MKIYLISGDGNGAGKSTFAKKVGDEVWSIAGALREDLARQYPGHPWFSKDQDVKDKYRIPDYGDGKYTIRQALIEYGQKKCETDPEVWVRAMVDRLNQSASILSGAKVYVVDDVRKVCEIEHVKRRFPVGTVTHFHLTTEGAGREPEYQNDELGAMADYLVKWKR